MEPFLSKSRTKREKPSRRGERHATRAPISISGDEPFGPRIRLTAGRSSKASIRTSSGMPTPLIRHEQQIIYVDRLIKGVDTQVFVQGPGQVSSPKVVSKIYVIPSILWVGKDHNNLFAQGSLYGFNCQWASNLDLSSLQQAKCLVVSDTEVIDKTLNIVNFACEYGIPTIWLHRHLPPEVCYWSFTKKLHVDDTKFFWSELCQMIA